MSDIPPANQATLMVADTPMADTPMADTPMADAPMADAPMADAPMADAPMANTPMADTPMADALMADAPMADAPMADAPIADAPMADTPMADTPMADTPMAHAPVPVPMAVPVPEVHPADRNLSPFHVYVIACLDGQYRCLGGVCVPSPYERAFKEHVVVSLRQIFSHPSNHKPARLELELGANFYAARRGYPDLDLPTPPPTPSPNPSNTSNPSDPSNLSNTSSEEEQHQQQQPPCSPCFPFIHTCLCVGSMSMMEYSLSPGLRHFGESVFPLPAGEMLGYCPVGCHANRLPRSERNGGEGGMQVVFVDITNLNKIRHRFGAWECELDPALRVGKVEHLRTGWSLPAWPPPGIHGHLFDDQIRDLASSAARIELGTLRGKLD